MRGTKWVKKRKKCWNVYVNGLGAKAQLQPVSEDGRALSKLQRRLAPESLCFKAPRAQSETQSARARTRHRSLCRGWANTHWSLALDASFLIRSVLLVCAPSKRPTGAEAAPGTAGLKARGVSRSSLSSPSLAPAASIFWSGTVNSCLKGEVGLELRDLVSPELRLLLTAKVLRFL